VDVNWEGDVTMVDSNIQDGKKLARESKPQVSKPETCPKCGGKKVSSCPGGSQRIAIQGIWWSCDDCHHEW
jgi:hypothetical protein